MRPANAFVAMAACALIAVGVHAADQPGYNKTDTFEPGKKYTCVPSADRKGWDCNEAGKAKPPAPDKSLPATSPAPPPVAEAPKAVAPIAPSAASPPRSSTLPSYLTSAAAENPAPPTPPPSTISATANRANAAPAESFESPPPARPSKPAPMPAQPMPKATARVAAVSVKPAKTMPIERPVAVSKPHDMAAPSSNFMDLSGDRFVIELAHTAKQSSLAEPRGAIHVPRGEVYELHLRQNGTDAWLLLWGPFDNIEAARAARSELAQTTSNALGFPRRVAPLQAEARRVSE